MSCLLDCWKGHEAEFKSPEELTTSVNDKLKGYTVEALKNERLRIWKLKVSKRQIERYISELLKDGELEKGGRGRYRPSKFLVPPLAAFIRAMEERVHFEEAAPLNVSTWLKLANFPSLESLNQEEMERVGEAREKLTEFLALMESVRVSFWMRESGRLRAESGDKVKEEFDRILKEHSRLAGRLAYQGLSEERKEAEWKELDSKAGQTSLNLLAWIRPPSLEPYVSEPLVATISYLRPALEIDTAEWMLGAFKTRPSHYSMLYPYFYWLVKRIAAGIQSEYREKDEEESLLQRNLKRWRLDDAGIQSRALEWTRKALLNFVDLSFNELCGRLAELEAALHERKRGDGTMSAEDLVLVSSAYTPEGRRVLGQTIDGMEQFKRAMPILEQTARALLDSDPEAAEATHDGTSYSREFHLLIAIEYCRWWIVGVTAERVVIEDASGPMLIRLSAAYLAPFPSQLERWKMAPKDIESSIRGEAHRPCHGD